MPYNNFRGAFETDERYDLTAQQPLTFVLVHGLLDLPISKSYVYFFQDNALPQGEGYGWNPHMSIRLGQFRLIVGDGDHFTDTLTRPDLVAWKLYEAGRD